MPLSFNANNIVNTIHFNSKPKPEKVERATFYPETVEIVDRVYDNYQKSLNEVSFHDVKTTALKVSNDTQTPKKDVLKAMQLLTQFSNIKGLKTISNTLNKSGLNSIGNDYGELGIAATDAGFSMGNVGRIASETGIHRALTYALDIKNLAPFDFTKGNKIGIILDSEKISQLERVKQSEPEKFDKFAKDKGIKFFYISGFENGISVMDRNKDLETKTKELLATAKDNDLTLEEAVDYPYMDRIKDLGISPVVIRNENTPSEIGVYNQMRPEKMMTKNTLYNVIEANTLTRVEDDATEDEKSLFNHIGAKYLDETLTVYTPEKMSKDLKLMHEKIEDYSKKTGKKPVYYVPNSKDIKSLDYISYSYRKINDMPASSFIPSGRLNAFYKIHSDYDKDNSFVVILDDCALSGGSMRSELAYDSDILKLDSNIPVVFANLKVSTEAMNNFENPSRHPVDIIYIDQINSEPIRSDAFSQVVGDPQYKENAYSLVFPYMAPDNNSQLATNVALLHNSKYNSENFSTKFNRESYSLKEFSQLPIVDANMYMSKIMDKKKYSACIKNITDEVLRTSKQYAKLIGTEPEISKSEEKRLTLDKEEPKTFYGLL